MKIPKHLHLYECDKNNMKIKNPTAGDAATVWRLYGTLINNHKFDVLCQACQARQTEIVLFLLTKGIFN